MIRDYAQQSWQATPQTVLTTAQVQDVLNQIFVRRAEREGGVPEVRNIQPIYSPLFAPVVDTFKTLSARPGLMFIALVIALAIFWLAKNYDLRNATSVTTIPTTADTAPARKTEG